MQRDLVWLSFLDCFSLFLCCNLLKVTTSTLAVSLIPIFLVSSIQLRFRAALEVK